MIRYLYNEPTGTPGISTGNFKAEENNIKDDEYDDFAEYMAHVANYMTREMKLKVRSVSPMNEPNTNYWPAMNYKQEGCHIDAGESQSKLLVLTKEALGRYGLNDIVLTTSDETNPGKQIEEIKTLTPAARAAINRISVHTYGTNSIREMGGYLRHMCIHPHLLTILEIMQSK